jgi:hypothetical protein
MDPNDSLTEGAHAPALERSADAPRAAHGTVHTSWDPHEVWLTRVKRPRDLAARLSRSAVTGS